MLSLFIILLGCSNYFILNDRVNTLNNYINSLKVEDISKITIFLSGGIKDFVSTAVGDVAGKTDAVRKAALNKLLDELLSK